MKTAEKTLTDAIALLTHYLTELSDIRDTPTKQFAYGEKTAYTECLEMLLEWNEAAKNGLTFDVEKVFPL